MNYQILLESYASGESISEDELPILELELDTQIETIKTYHLTVVKRDSKKSFEAVQVREGSWLDQVY